MKNIATDIFTFEELRKKDCLYVDKTRYIWNILNSGSSTFFLSRPRRFGKSLLLSTFKAYFEGKRELFEGLEIEKLKTDEWEKFPVIHLDLASGSSLKSYEEIVTNWKTQLSKSYSSLGIEEFDGSPAQMLDNLMSKVNEKYGKKVVVLIDEYDKPILDSMFEPYIKDVVKDMSDFYQKLKSANEIERFVFITGVTKFAHVSLFSGSNNPTDLTRNAKYATMLGYTEDELRENFSEYIDELAEETHKDRESLLAVVKRWYNGTRFVRNCESVYNPVSIGKLFYNLSFDNYWATTGTPKFLLNIVKKKPFELNDYTQQWVLDVASDKYDLQNLPSQAVAIQTGYLSIAECVPGDDVEWLVRYDFPNKEIRDTWFSNIVTLTTGYNDYVLSPLLVNMTADLKKKDAEAFMDKVVRFFSGIPYENAGEISEGYFRNQLRTLFCLFGIPNQCEVMEASQRVDIVAQTKEMALVFELKMMEKGEKDAENKRVELLEEAMEQGRKKGYAEKYANESEVVKLVGVVFDEETRKVAEWRME